MYIRKIRFVSIVLIILAFAFGCSAYIPPAAESTSGVQYTTESTIKLFADNTLIFDSGNPYASSYTDLSGTHEFSVENKTGADFDFVLWISGMTGVTSLAGYKKSDDGIGFTPEAGKRVEISVTGEDIASLDGITVTSGDSIISCVFNITGLTSVLNAGYGSGDEIILCSDAETDGEITISRACTVTLNGHTLRAGKMMLTAGCKGTFEVNTKKGGMLTAENFYAESPECDLIWADCPLSLTDIAVFSDLKSFNGTDMSDYKLGGNGQASIQSLSMLSSENDNISADIVWTIEGNIIYASFSGVLDMNSLRNAVLTVETDGKVSFGNNSSGKIDLLDENGVFCTVTDINGNIQRYAVITEYIPSCLPVVVIYTENEAEITSKDEYTEAEIYINCDNTGEYPSLGKTPVQIKGRGNSTWKWDKKPYKLKFYSKTSVLGLSAARKWTLLANYADKSLIRNYVAFEGAKVLDNMIFAPSQYPVDVFINGEYRWVYTLGEQIEIKSGRVGLIDNGTDADTGYLLELGGSKDGDIKDVTYFSTGLMKWVTVKTSAGDLPTAEQMAYIKDYVSKADAAVIALDGYEEYIDIYSLIDWFIATELYYNLDSCFRRSCYLTKDAGGKLTMGPLWDFDLAMGNMWKDYGNYEAWACLSEDYGYVWTNWMTYLMTDNSFRTKLKARWDEVGDKLLETTLDAIDKMSAKVSASAAYNFEVWDILDIRVGFEPALVTKYNTYELQIKYLREFIVSRRNWMDKNI